MLLGDAQRLARGRDLAFRLPRAIGGLKSVEKRLRRSGAELAGRQVRAEAGIDGLVWKHLLVDRFGELVEVIEAAGRSDTELWPVA